jgi:pSer/pThr/pTyr-binding forkhead associated (FHA) protein
MPAPLAAVPPAQPFGGQRAQSATPLFPSDPPPPSSAAPPAPAPASRPCPSCGTEVPAAFAFCGACGTRLSAAAAQPVRTGDTADLARQAAVETRPKGRLTLIRPDGSEGGVHDLVEGENKLGREHGAIFENDGYLSPAHAELIVNAAGAVVRDLDSLNGVFVKMNGEEELEHGQIFRIGQELMRFDTIAPPEPLEDGTEIMGSPNPGYWGRLSVIIGKDVDGSAFPLFGDAVTIGRERGDINFPDDGYVSGLHARVTTRNGRFYLADLGSSNGTFMRIDRERQLSDGSFVLLGQQLFRVTINP